MKKGFTLVELLVVIAILGILMAMMVPAAGIILNRASKARAKADANVVVSVMMKYRAEYNRWPGFSTNNAAQHLTDAVWVDAMSPAPGTPMPPSNPKRIVFFEAGAGALATNLPHAGAFVDSWGSPFEYQVDLDGNGEMGHPADDGQTFQAQVIAWSAGKDGDYKTWDDNVPSWE